MADSRTARLLTSEPIGIDSRLLRFAVDRELGFIGGQYIIVNTGIPLGEGKVAKRAYSLLSSDTDQCAFEIAVRRVNDGPGSNWMLELREGAEMPFTGPWGKFLPPRVAESNSCPADTVLVVATDTGITAALGLLRGSAFGPTLAHTRCVWLADAEQAFVSERFVRERIPQQCAHFEYVQVPSDASARSRWSAECREALLAGADCTAAYLSGDGFLLASFRDALRELPQPPEIFVESFFHHQDLKAVAKGISP